MLRVSLPIILVALGVTIGSCGGSLSEAEDSKYLGMVVPDFPDSLEKLDGWMLSQERGYPLRGALVRENETGNYFVLLGAKRSGQREKRLYSIVQVIPLEPLEDNQRIMTGIMDQCGIAGQYDEELVLLGTSPPPEKPYVTEFRRGWKVNYETQRLDEISVNEADYRCENVAHTL